MILNVFHDEFFTFELYLNARDRYYHDHFESKTYVKICTNHFIDQIFKVRFFENTLKASKIESHAIHVLLAKYLLFLFISTHSDILFLSFIVFLKMTKNIFNMFDKWSELV